MTTEDQVYTVTVEADGTQKWTNSASQLHRLDGPAVIRADGTKFWFKEGKKHRLDGPAVTHSGGAKYWFLEGKLHRESGPAVIYADGSKEWYKEDKRHRLDGPAVIYPDGSKAWYIEGKRVTEEEFNNRNNKVELTIAEIAEKLNIDPSLLRIKD